VEYRKFADRNPIYGTILVHLDLLSSFIDIAEAGSLAKASSRTGVPTSTLSRNLARLEAELGLRLVQRSTRALTLSEDGRQLYQRTAAQVQLLKEELQLAAHATAEPRGLLRLTAPSSFGRVVLAPLIAEFMARYPSIEVEALLVDRRVNLIEEGVDLAFRMGALADSALIARTVGTVERVLCASPGYLDAHGRPQQPSDLRQHRFLALTRELQTFDLESATGPKQHVSLHASLVCAPADALLPSLLAGVGIAWVPGFHVYQPLQAGLLERVLPDWHLPPSTIHMVYPSARSTPRKLSAFMDFVAQALAQDPHFNRA
jgi:DNA-binding transcriptional LysR family regulator